MSNTDKLFVSLAEIITIADVPISTINTGTIRLLDTKFIAKAINNKKITTKDVVINSLIPKPRINSNRVFTLVGIYSFVLTLSSFKFLPPS